FLTWGACLPRALESRQRCEGRSFKYTKKLSNRNISTSSLQKSSVKPQFRCRSLSCRSRKLLLALFAGLLGVLLFNLLLAQIGLLNDNLKINRTRIRHARQSRHNHLLLSPTRTQHSRHHLTAVGDGHPIDSNEPVSIPKSNAQ